MLAISRLIEAPFRARDLVLLAVALGLAFLTKGPVAVVLPLLAVFVLLALRPGIGSPGRLAAAVAIASAAATVVFLVWFLPADRAAAGQFWSVGIGREVVGRALRPRESHGGIRVLGLPYYVTTIVIGFSPWTIFLPGAVSAAAGGRLGGPLARGLLLGWILSPLLLFSFAATRLPHYILPAFPALAIAVAATLEADRRGTLTARDRAWLRRGVWLFGPVAALETIGLLAGTRVFPEPLRRPALLLAAIVAGSSAVAIAFQLASRFRRAAGTVFAGAAAAQIAVAVFALPALEREKPTPRVAIDVRSRFPGNIPVATLGFSEPSLDYYLDRPPVERLAGERDLVRWCASPGAGVLVATREALAAGPPAALERLAEFASRRGFNYSKGRWIELVALERRALPP
jgi:4-amino-4-deoxy-L-arabinose transferase-like glycosyltransferase